MKIVALVPARNEPEIGATIESLLNQTTPVEVVVVANGCTDNTAELARQYPVIVMDLPRLPNGKSQAMNMAWHEHCRDADFVLTVDADTTLEPQSAEQWMEEFAAEPELAGSCARFTMRSTSFLGRLQRFDFSVGIDISLRRGWSSVLAGAGSCFRNSILHIISQRSDREGPWTYDSTVEDFELTYQLRRLGLKSKVSSEVRAYTDHMRTWRALRGQREKWTAGTINDLLRFGLNKTTLPLWGQQLHAFACVLVMLLTLSLVVPALLSGALSFGGLALVVPGLVLARYIKMSLRVPGWDWKDVAMGASIIVYEMFSWTVVAWFLHAWASVIWEKICRTSKDRWELQYAAEGR